MAQFSRNTAAMNAIFDDVVAARGGQSSLAAAMAQKLDKADVSISILAVDDADNPTAGTPSESSGIRIVFSSSESTYVGLKIFACTMGDIYAAAKMETVWDDWHLITGS